MAILNVRKILYCMQCLVFLDFSLNYRKHFYIYNASAIFTQVNKQASAARIFLLVSSEYFQTQLTKSF